MSFLLQDVRFALRLLARSPAVTTVAILSLALGVGANPTVFTLVNAILLNPLPVREVSRLVTIGTSEMRNGAPVDSAGTSRLNVDDLRAQNNVFSGVTLMGFAPIALSGSGEPEQLLGQMVTGNFFDVLAAPIAAGRTFVPEEDLGFNTSGLMVLGINAGNQGFDEARDATCIAVRSSACTRFRACNRRRSRPPCQCSPADSLGQRSAMTRTSLILEMAV